MEFHSKTLYDACTDLKSDMFMVSIFSWGITFVIVFVNFLMGRITYALIQWVKFANKSEEMGAIVKVLFLCYFFNTGLSILIVNMNFKE